VGQAWDSLGQRDTRLALDLHYLPGNIGFVFIQNEPGRFKKMGLGRIVEAGAITWLLGGGFLMFIIVLLLLKAC
jgi:hypothetical protein